MTQAEQPKAQAAPQVSCCGLMGILALGPKAVNRIRKGLRCRE